MSKVKRVFANFSFYDHSAIEKKLEQMAANGWMIRNAGSLFWTYEKIQPQSLRFAVTYFPSASEFDPYPSDKQLEKEALCAQDGWRLVLRWDAMQVFCTDREDAVPIETDPIPQVENIHRTMKKKLLTGQLFTLAVSLWYLYLQISQLRDNPVDYDLRYEIIDVKIPALYPFIQESLINARQDEVHDDIIFTDHYEPIDPGPWNAQAVYQRHWSDSVLDEYLVCWETRLVKITFYWTPTQEQIGAAAAILQP